MATNYKDLRSAYDLAFRQFAAEMQYVNQFETVDDLESNNLVIARQQLEDARCCYLQARNALASYLLSRQAESCLAFAAPTSVNDSQQRPSVEELAVFFWEDAAKPSGNDQANWYRAKTGYSRRGSPAPFVPC